MSADHVPQADLSSTIAATINAYRRHGNVGAIMDDLRRIAAAAEPSELRVAIAEYSSLPEVVIPVYEVLTRRDPRRELVGAEAGGAERVLDKLPEGLGRDVHPLEEPEAGRRPAGGASRQERDVGEAEPLEALPRPRRDPVPLVEEHDRRGAAGHEPERLGLEPAERDVDREQRMPLAVPARLAHVEERQLPGALEPLLGLSRVQRPHVSRSLLDGGAPARVDLARQPRPLGRLPPASLTAAARGPYVRPDSQKRPAMRKYHLISSVT
jgi:hypothetical protein